MNRLITNELSASFSADCEINYELLKKLIPMNIGEEPWEIVYVKIVQARKHRKKRINKKWLKRYGYKQQLVKSKGWKVTYHTDGTFELIKEIGENNEREC